MSHLPAKYGTLAVDDSLFGKDQTLTACLLSRYVGSRFGEITLQFPYDSRAVALVKAIANAAYDVRFREWSISVDQASDLLVVLPKVEEYAREAEAKHIVRKENFRMGREEFAVIHIAQKEAGLSDGDYRDLLDRVASISSSKDIKDLGTFERVVDALVQQKVARDVLSKGAAPADGQSLRAQRGLIFAIGRQYG